MIARLWSGMSKRREIIHTLIQVIKLVDVKDR
jgi:hypothetical protein